MVVSATRVTGIMPDDATIIARNRAGVKRYFRLWILWFHEACRETHRQRIGGTVCMKNCLVLLGRLRHGVVDGSAVSKNRADRAADHEARIGPPVNHDWCGRDSE